MRTKRFFIALFMLVVGGQLIAQQFTTEIAFNKRQVYVGEPMQVSVSIYTSTWFTTGVDPGDIKVNGAFTVFFRTISVSKSINGKTHPGVEMIFNVFPFEAEDVTFPSLEINVESPAEGDFVGKPHVVKTNARIIKVMPIPPAFSADNWLVASGLSVNQNWVGNTAEVKVGDVLERTITRRADATLAELLPPIQWDSLNSVSLYPGRSSVSNNKSKTAISASRTEVMRYLFEQEGEVILPTMEFTWWNPYQQKLFKRTLAEMKINVLPNPDLGMLASVKDSLAVLAQQQLEAEQEEGPFTILGFRPEVFALIALLAAGLVWALFKLVKRIAEVRRKSHEAYIHSELFFFRAFTRAIKNGDAVQSHLYRWIDKLELPEPTVEALIRACGNSELQDRIHGKSLVSILSSISLAEWKELRGGYYAMVADSGNKVVTGSLWINP
ncbi:BatD family protein [Roseivirga pacifica]|uniref:BatD family protein n=1 Tax=Roseivirga pacifica TaxID=1267423 RepID=UPI00227A9346|nr:BatD family protein [Roseivirga pacifica]